MCPGHKDVPRARRAPCNRRAASPAPRAQNGEYRKKLNYMGLFNDWLDRAGCVP